MYLHGKFTSPPYLDKTQIYGILRSADATILGRCPLPFNFNVTAILTHKKNLMAMTFPFNIS